MPSEIDLRSDTVTMPTDEMLEAMRNAQLGDDVYREDPTVQRLEELAAKKVGKEASLFVVSGTMGNLTSVLTHCKRGDEVILEAESHTYYYEVGGISALGGVIPKTIPGKRGAMDPKDIEDAIRPENIHYAQTGLICLENTHNRAGGTVIPLDILEETHRVAQGHNLPIHLDGARVFNAAIYLGVDVKEITKYVDSVMFCLSKGLSAPVGSMLAGSKEFIERGRKVRKMLGGGMRQAGVLAAAGIVALEKMVDRLGEDHDNARILGEGLAKIEGLELDIETVQTNMVVFDVSPLGISSDRFLEELREYGVKASNRPPTKVRMVTNRHITREDARHAIEAVEKIAHSYQK